MSRLAAILSLCLLATLSSAQVASAQDRKGAVALLAASAPAKKTGHVSFQNDVKPLLAKYCYGCHGETKKKGDLSLEAYTDEARVQKDRPIWEKVLKNLSIHEMPPEKKPQPTSAERELITRWIASDVFHYDCNHPDPGRVTIRRLNRIEYNNTIRDLVGVDFQPAEDFPADDSGYGFDNIGDVLSLSPTLLEKYLAAAEKIFDQAIVTEDPAQARIRRFDAEKLDGSAPGEAVETGGRRLAREGDLFVKFNFPTNGEYLLRAKAYGEQAGPDPARMTVRLGDQDLQTFDVPVTATNPHVYEVRATVPAGTNRFAASYINNFVDRTKNLDRNLVIEYLEIVSPINALPPLPDTHKRIFICEPAPGQERECAGKIIASFARRAFRRPVSADDVNRLIKLTDLAHKQGENFAGSIKVALQAVLVSPYFLFRGELQPDPGNPASVHPVDEFSLASRLSYFLWSSMPDEALFALAERRQLRKNLEPQVKRMLKDPKARALVDNFAGQWLQLRNIKLATPDKGTFPDFDDALRLAMQQETELFFEGIMREDRSVLELLNADYTFLNERLARHYGISGVKGEQFQRVSLKGTPRGGILTHASILTLTSNPTRTSPVKRGKYVLENLLGTPPPPPPPDVPELAEGKELTGTLRQRMEQHRSNALCASCHARMDPIGFGLENFDGIGAWRVRDGNSPIDPSGQLVTGEMFKGPAGLTAILAKQKRDDFIRCLSEKMLTYALGRGVEYYDKCAVDEISRGLAKGRYRFSALALEVIKSTPFQMRRGESEKLAQTESR